MKKFIALLIIFLMFAQNVYAQTPGTYRYITTMKPKPVIPDTTLVLRYRKSPSGKNGYTAQSLHLLFNII